MMNKTVHLPTSGLSEEQRSYMVGAAMAWVSMFILASWIFPVLSILVGAALGIWMVSGSGSIAFRMIVSVAALIPVQAGNPMLACIGGMTLAWSVLFALLTRKLMAWYGKIPGRPYQFTIWEMGGVIVACGLAFAFVSTFSIALQGTPIAELVMWSIGTCYVGGCCALASCPLSVPPSARVAIVWQRAYVTLLGVVPVLTGLVNALFWPGPILGTTIYYAIVLFFANGFGAFFLWIVLAPMLWGGMFATFPMPTTEKTP